MYMKCGAIASIVGVVGVVTKYTGVGITHGDVGAGLDSHKRTHAID